MDSNAKTANIKIDESAGKSSLFSTTVMNNESENSETLPLDN